MSFNDQLRLTGLLLMTAMAGCGGGGASTSPAKFSVGGSVNGLLVGSVSLQLNDIETVRVESNGAFIFRTSLPAGANYVVTRVFPPPPFDWSQQVCSVSNSNGTVVTNVTDVSVNCTTPDRSNVAMISNTPGSELQLAIHASGTAFAVWVTTQRDSGRKDIWANRFVVDSGWGTPVLLESNDVGSAHGPKIAMDAAGNAVAVWAQYDGTQFDIWESRYSIDSGWSPATLVERNGVIPDLAIDASGNVLVVWARSDGAHSTIWGNRYVPGSGWRTASIVGGAGNAAGFSDLAMDASGNAIAVWTQFNSADVYSNTWANHYSVDAGWGTATVIGSGTSVVVEHASVAIDPFGNAVAVWQQMGGASVSNNIWSNRYVAGSGWSTATSIQTGSGPASTPEVAVDMNGNALAVWRQPDLARVSIWANRYVAGRGWGAGTLIESDSSGDASAPELVLHAGGNALVVWPQIDRFNRTHLWANRYSPVSGWGQVTLVQDNVDTVPPISVAPNANGSNLVSWSESQEKLAGIWVRYVD
jgi:hypothetical protein